MVKKYGANSQIFASIVVQVFAIIVSLTYYLLSMIQS